MGVTGDVARKLAQPMNVGRIVRGVGANAYGNLVVSGVQIALVPVLAAHWGLETYGAWLLLATVPIFLAMSDLGFATAAGTRMIMLVARGERDEAVAVFQSAWSMVLACSAAMLVLAVAVAWLLPGRWLPQAPGFDSEQARITLTVLIVYGISSLQGGILIGGMRSAGYYPLAAFWSANTILLENLAVIAVVLLGGTPIEAAAALLVCRTAALLGQAFLLRTAAPWLTFGFRQATIAEIKTLSAPAFGVMALPIGQAASLQGTALALGAAAGEAAVPAFAAARTLSRIGLQLTQLVVHAIMPEFSGAVARDDRLAQSAMLLATLACSGLVLIPFAAVLGIFGPRIVDLWTGGAIHASQSLMLVMMASALLGGFWWPLSNLILAMNRHAGYAYPFVALALLSVPVAYGLSLELGPTGAALSMALMDGAMCVLVIRLARRLFGGQVDMGTALRLAIARVRGLLRG